MKTDRLKELAGINENFMGQPPGGYPPQHTNAGSMLRSFMTAVTEFAKYEIDDDEIREDLLRLIDEYKQRSVRVGRGGMG